MIRSVLAGALLSAGPVRAQTFQDLRQMSLDELANVDVSSVTKTPQPLSDAPAAIYVISHDAIARSGATTIPEALRLAPNLQVEQTSSSQYVISARGLSGNPDAQNFANKLLVLIDGRSVYTPLFSGVYWDSQDVVLADVDRIEVISGPGATLWGANAVNGVINIITRGARDTQGLLAEATGGTLDRTATVRYGGVVGDALSYRLYVQGIQGDATRTAAGVDAQDDRWRVQGGFRLDWTPAERDRVTVQGDAYGGAHGQLGAADERISGRNLLARWNRSGAAGSNLQVQAYYDRTVRASSGGAGRFFVDTYDLDAQQSFAAGGWNAIVVGGGVRASRYHIQGANGLDFVPPRRTLWLVNGFVQDTITLRPSLNLVLGLKLEDDPFGGLTPLPSGRIAWKPGPALLLWGAVSRAIRSATPFEHDVVESAGPTVLLNGDRNFRSEKLTAYELGTRYQPSPRFSVSVSAFYQVYDDLRSIEYTPVTIFPLRWDNGLKGPTHGVESWADWQLRPWWKLSAAVSFLHEDFRFDESASGFAGVAQLGSDPKHNASIRSAMDLCAGVTLDAALRHVGPFPDPRLPAYLELDGRLGWRVDNRMTLSITGANLLHKRHQEYPGSSGNLIPRQVMAGLQWRL